MSIRKNRLVTAVAALVSLGLLVSLSGCNSPEPNDNPSQSGSTPTTGPITVVASINQWGSLAQEIGGSDVTVTSILSSTTVDAHNFEPQTSDIAKLSKADVIVINGAGYDTWAQKNRPKKAQVVSAAETVGAMEGDNPHLWFSKDARKSVASELAEIFSKARPAKKKAFATRLSTWQKEETKLEESLSAFGKAHPKARYAATEPVASYLMSDLGFKDETPQGYAQAAASEGEVAPADLQDFQKLIEKRDIDVLINNTQQPSDATNLLTGTAERSSVPVFPVSEQMPSDAKNLTGWISSLVESLTKLLQTEKPASGETSSSSSDSGNTNNPSNNGSTSQSESPSNQGQTDPGK